MTKEAFIEKIENSMKQVEAGKFIAYLMESFQN